MIMKGNGESFRPESLLRQMERMMGRAVKGGEDERKAQDLVYDAWETMDPEEVCALLEQAVELDPANVDAWLGLMNFVSLTDEEQVETFRKLVAQGEENLGEELLGEKGHFWGVLETRPYMRARAQLALKLMEMGRYGESIVEHEAILELNPNDNQGVRYGLMSCYLATGDLTGARRLIEQYNERGFSTVWAWAYVLECFLSGEMEAAERALREAREQNPSAQAYFLGHRKLPRNMPGSYSLGSRDEAVVAWDILGRAWTEHPEVVVWLEAQRKRKDAPSPGRPCAGDFQR